MYNTIVFIAALIGLAVMIGIWYKRRDHDSRVVVAQFSILTLYALWGYYDFVFLPSTAIIVRIIVKILALALVIWVYYRMLKILWKE
jgi:hypothetical protein